MTYNYLDITNKVLKPFNEVNLTSVTFAAAKGFHADVKDAINKAILDIYQFEELEWPFAWAEYTFSTVAGTRTYSKSASAAKIDWDSFFISRDVVNNVPHTKLALLEYDGFRYNQLVRDSNTDENSLPAYIVRLPNNNFQLSPTPDIVYTVNYQGFSYPTLLEDYDDVPVIPEAYSHVIVNQALYYAYMFRDNYEQAAIAQKTAMDSIHAMRRIEIPQQPYLRFVP